MGIVRASHDSCNNAVRKLRELERERAAGEATMNRYLAELGYGS